MTITSFIEKGNGEFLATFDDLSDGKNGSSIINFTYNSDIPSTSQNKLLVYSLTENPGLREAIYSCAKNNPNICIEYEIGLTYEDGITQSDAIKTLNTEIMAGNGPDIIILDGLSAKSYIEKGLLEDISDIINPLVEDGEVFKNIADTYNVDGKIYQFPTTFKFPILLGNEENVNSVKDLDSLVEVTKQLSLQKEKMIFSNSFTPKSLVYSLYYLYGSNWLNNNNTINKNNLTNFFIKANEMYIAIQKNEENYLKYMKNKYEEQSDVNEIVEEEEVDEKLQEENNEEVYDFLDMQYLLNPSINADLFLFEDSTILSYGSINDIYSYSTIVTTLFYNSNLNYKLLSKNDEYVFIPSNIIAVNAKGKNKEEAKKIVKELFSENNQKKMCEYGLPVNINTLKSKFDIEEHKKYGHDLKFDKETKHYITSISSYEDTEGNLKEIKFLLPNEDDVNKLISEIEKLNVEATVNTVLLTEVAKQFELYSLGKISLEKAVNNVIDDLELYLSE